MGQQHFVEVSFREAGELFLFDANNLKVSANDPVIVQTEHGPALGTVKRVEVVDNEAPSSFQIYQLLRIATQDDLRRAARHQQKEREAFEYCRQKVEEYNLPMKLIRAENFFNGSKLLFYFSAEGRVDFRTLVRDLARYFQKRIEMRQIGVRDSAKLIGGIGACGQELCCSRFLRQFHPVSIRMVKDQNLPLNQQKVSGACGRLMCCLAYEQGLYKEMRKRLPKVGQDIETPKGMGKVREVQPLQEKVRVVFLEERPPSEEEYFIKDLPEFREIPRPDPTPVEFDQQKRNKRKRRRGLEPLMEPRRGGGGGPPNDYDDDERIDGGRRPQRNKPNQNRGRRGKPPSSEESRNRPSERNESRSPQRPEDVAKQQDVAVEATTSVAAPEPVTNNAPVVQKPELQVAEPVAEAATEPVVAEAKNQETEPTSQETEPTSQETEATSQETEPTSQETEPTSQEAKVTSEVQETAEAQPQQVSARNAPSVVKTPSSEPTTEEKPSEQESEVKAEQGGSPSKRRRRSRRRGRRRNENQQEKNQQEKTEGKSTAKSEPVQANTASQQPTSPPENKPPENKEPVTKSETPDATPAPATGDTTPKQASTAQNNGNNESNPKRKRRRRRRKRKKSNDSSD